jgi:hypothetical protein
LAIFASSRGPFNKNKVKDSSSASNMFALLFDLEDYATTYRATRDAYLKAANGA